MEYRHLFAYLPLIPSPLSKQPTSKYLEAFYLWYIYHRNNDRVKMTLISLIKLCSLPSIDCKFVQMVQEEISQIAEEIRLGSLNTADLPEVLEGFYKKISHNLPLAKLIALITKAEISSKQNLELQELITSISETLPSLLEAPRINTLMLIQKLQKHL